MTDDGVGPGRRVDEARELLRRCGVDEGLADDEAVRRADAIADAAAEYSRSAADANAAVLDEHLRAEFELHDAAETMKTMAPDPYLHHVPVLTGGVGREAVHDFYRDDFVSAWPRDTETRALSRTATRDRVVDEVIVSFTHDVEMPFLLPGVAPTGRRVELPHTVAVGFEAGKVAHEHVYWDQACVLVQVGLLDPEGLPVTGAEQARALLDVSGG